MHEQSTRIFQDIADLVLSHIDGNWEQANVEAEFDEGLVDFCVTYVDSGGKEQDLEMESYFNIVSGLKENFVSLRDITKDEEKGRWSKCVFVMHSDGRIKTDFSYGPSRWAKADET